MKPDAIITMKGDPSTEQIEQIRAMFDDDRLLVLPEGWEYRVLDHDPFTLEQSTYDPSAIPTILAIGGWIVAGMFAISTVLLWFAQ